MAILSGDDLLRVLQRIEDAVNAAPAPVAVSNLPATQPVSGSVAVSNLPATQPVSGTVAVSNLPATQAVSEARPTAPAVSSVAPGIGNNTLLAANAARKGASFFNDSGARCWLREGVGASDTAFTRLLRPGEAYDLPFPAYTGQIDGYFQQAPPHYVVVTERT